MREIEICTSRQKFQKSIWRLYLHDLRNNEKLLGGLKKLMLFTIAFLIISLIPFGHFLKPLQIIISILLITFLGLVIVGVISTWTDNRKESRRLNEEFQNITTFCYSPHEFFFIPNPDNIKYKWDQIITIIEMPTIQTLVLKRFDNTTVHISTKIQNDYNDLVKYATMKIGEPSSMNPDI